MVRYSWYLTKLSSIDYYTYAIAPASAGMALRNVYTLSANEYAISKTDNSLSSLLLN